MERRVSFYSDACKLAGTMFVPDHLPRTGQGSGIIFCSGFAAIRDTSLLACSRHLFQQGYIGLSFDYRGFGESSGTKWRVRPLEHVEDVRSAITFLQQQPEVAGDSIGLFGGSFGGAIATQVAATDSRVKCTITQVTTGNGRKWLQSLRSNREWQAFLEELEEDRIRSMLTGTSKMVDKLHIMVPDEKTRAYHEERLEKYPSSCSELSLDSARAVIEFSPEEVVHKIAPRPILFIVAENDVLAPVEFAKELYDRAGHPKKFKVIPGASHHDTYSTEPYSQEVRDEALEWLKCYLPAKTH